MTVITMALLGVAAVIGVAGIAARHHSANMIRQQHCMKAFFKAAHVMVADPRTPDLLKDDIYRFSDHLRDAGLVRALLRMQLNGELRLAARDRRTSDRSRSLSDLPPELSELAAVVFVNFVYSASYSSLLAGPLLRRTLFLLSPDRVRGDDQMKRNAFQLMTILDDRLSPAC